MRRDRKLKDRAFHGRALAERRTLPTRLLFRDRMPLESGHAFEQRAGHRAERSFYMRLFPRTTGSTRNICNSKIAEGHLRAVRYPRRAIVAAQPLGNAPRENRATAKQQYAFGALCRK